jgi:hypothetical protein
MREGTTKHLVLLGVELYKISEKLIYDLRNSEPRKPDNAFEHLPEYTINTNSGAKNQPIPAKYFHQFLGFSFDENKDCQKYLYFNLKTADALLQEEIDNSGVDDLFKDFDFKYLFRFFKPEPEENFRNFRIPFTNYLVVELTYITSYDHYSGGYDVDMEIDVVGYLNSTLQIQYFQ